MPGSQPSPNPPPAFRLSPLGLKPTHRAKDFSAGVLAGLVNTALFNPYDKALYRMCHDHTSFFTASNWRSPYSGVSQAVWHRIVSYGLFFPLMDFWKDTIHNYGLLHSMPLPNTAQALAAAAKHQHSLSSASSAPPSHPSHPFEPVFAGALTGITTALLLNPLNVVKFHNWNHDTSEGLRVLATRLHKQHGARVFTRGLGYTMLRDTVYAIGYGWTSVLYNPEKHLLMDVACAATFVILVAYVSCVACAVLFCHSYAAGRVSVCWLMHVMWCGRDVMRCDVM
jgi:hypothetical protein